MCISFAHVDLDLAQLRAFAATVDEGSLDAAARRLLITPSAVSQRLKALETSVGRVLLVRSRPVCPTPAGDSVLRLARQVEHLAQEATAELGEGGTARTAVPVAVNADSLGSWALPALATVAQEVLLDIRREDEQVTSRLLRDGTVMAAITTEARPVPGCRSTVLGAMRYRPVAARSFVRRWFADGATAEALAEAPVVLFDRDDDLQHELLRRRGVTADPPCHYVPSTADHREAVRLGLGWGMLAGEIPDVTVVVDPDGAVERVLHWQRWRLSSRALDLVGEAVVSAARTHLSR